MGTGRILNKNHWEYPDVYYRAFTQYDMHNGTFRLTKKKPWENNYGGIPVGKNESGGSLCIDSSDSHSLVIGSTGSKKSRLVVMPTVKILADADESMIISDPKAEIYSALSYYLNRRGYHIRVINLRSPGVGDSWNPLAIPYSFYLRGDLDRSCEFLNDVSANLIQSEQNFDDPFWDNSAGNLFFGLSLFLFKICGERNLPENYVTINNVMRLRQDLENHMTPVWWKDARADNLIASSLIGTIEAPEKTRSSILVTFDEKVRIFAIQPSLAEMVSSNTLDMDEIGQKKSAVFLIMPDEKTTYHRLVSIFIKQSYEYLIYRAQNIDGRIRRRINYILDEFSSLPTIKDFPAMITASRSRNIRFNLVIQSRTQLRKRYQEESDTIMANCANWIFLTSKEIELLQDISVLCGKQAGGREELISIATLQHLNKERGEVLVISGRMYPFISILPDFSEYNVRGNCLDIPRREKREMAVFKYETTGVKNVRTVKRKVPSESENPDKRQGWTVSSGTEEDEIKKELEAKFDELFGDVEE